MNEQEIHEEIDRSFDHGLVKTFPLGNILTVGISLIAAAVSWGVTATKVSSVEEDVRILMSRDITPGAAQAIAAMQARDVAQDRQLVELREEMRDSRAEIVSELRAIREDLRNHDKER